MLLFFCCPLLNTVQWRVKRPNTLPEVVSHLVCVYESTPKKLLRPRAGVSQLF